MSIIVTLLAYCAAHLTSMDPTPYAEDSTQSLLIMERPPAAVEQELEYRYNHGLMTFEEQLRYLERHK